MVRTKTAATLVLALALSACATQWRHPSYSNTPALHEQRLAIDKGYCQQVAHGAAPHAAGSHCAHSPQWLQRERQRHDLWQSRYYQD